MLRPTEHTAYSLDLDGSEITRDETEFLLAMLAYQKRFRRRFPTWREVLNVARCLGYRKVAEPAPISEPPWVESTNFEIRDSRVDPEFIAD